MKPETMELAMREVTTQDRRATTEEIRRAISASHESLLGLCHTRGNYCEMDSDLGGVIRYPAEEFEFFAFLSEADETTIN